MQNLQEKTKVLYIKRLIDKKGLLEPYESLIERILSDQISSDMELLKIEGYKVYSVRINKKQRLLFAEIDHEMVVIDVMLNHKYKRYLRREFLKPFVEKCRRDSDIKIADDIELREMDFKPCQEKLKFIQKPGKIDYVALECYQKKFITFNQVQEEGIDASYPLIVTGVPGAGKSVIALSKCKGKGLVVTKFSGLADKLKEDYYGMIGAAATEVEFATFESLLRENAPELKDAEFVGEEHFVFWLKDHIKEFNKLKIRTMSLQEIYQECKFLVGLGDQDIALGHRHRLFKEENEIQVLRQICANYIQYLKASKKVNPAFFTRLLKTKYPWIHVDEAHKFAPQELSILIKLAKAQNIAFFLDTNQSLEVNLLIRKMLLMRILLVNNKKITEITLPYCYRCSSPIVESANRWLELKNLLTKRTDKCEPKQIALFKSPETDSENESVSFVFSRDRLDVVALNAAAENHLFAIIVPDKHASLYKEDAKKIFPKATIVSISESSGLEFTMVVLFNLIDDRGFREINALLLENQQSERVFKKAFNEPIRSLFSQIFTGMTRARSSLLIFQENSRGMEALLDYWQGTAPIVEIKIPQLAVSMEADWRQRVNECLRNNLMEQAMDIFNIRLSHLGSFEEYQSKINNKAEVEAKPASKVIPQTIKKPVKILTKPTRSPQLLIPTDLSKRTTISPQHFVDGFTSEVSIAKFEKLFNHPDLNNYLFKVKSSNNLTLFEIIMNNFCFLFFLNQSANSRELINKIEAGSLWNILSNQILAIMDNQLQIDVLRFLVEHHESLDTFFTIDVLCFKKDLMPSIWEKMMCSMTFKGNKLFNALDYKNPLRWNSLPISNIIYSKNRNINHLASLVQSSLGCKMLRNYLIVGVQRGLFEGKYIFQQTVKFPPLIYLVSHHEGLKTLQMMLNTVKDMHLLFTWENLNQNIKITIEGHSVKFTPFFNLIRTKLGIKIATSILERNKELLSQVQLEFLVRCYYDESSSHYLTVRDCLRKSQEGINLLHLMSLYNPDIAAHPTCFPEKIPTIMQTANPLSLVHITISGLTTDISRELLWEYYSTLDVFPSNLVKSFISEMRKGICAEEIIKAFAYDKYGIGILLIFGEKDPDFNKEFFSFIFERPEEAADYLCIFSATSIGIEFLNYIFIQNQNLLDVLTLEILTKPIFDHSKGTITVIENLEQCEQGKKLFQFLIDKNPKLHDALKFNFCSIYIKWKMAMTTYLTNNKAKEEQINLLKTLKLFFMLVNNNGVSEIKEYFYQDFELLMNEKNSNLPFFKNSRKVNVIHPYVRKIFSMLVATINIEQKSLALLDHLLSHGKLLGILETLFEVMPSLVHCFSVKTLCRKFYIKENTFITPFYLFLINKPAVVLLEKILHTNINLTKSFTEEIFTELYPDPDDNYEHCILDILCNIHLESNVKKNKYDLFLLLRDNCVGFVRALFALGLNKSPADKLTSLQF